VPNPPTLSPPYFNINFFLVGLFPKFFNRGDSRPPDSTDVSQAPINERLFFLISVLTSHVSLPSKGTDFTHEVNILLSLFL
jgi:hypothetical protein